MQFTSALSRESDTAAAVQEILNSVAAPLPEQHAHLSFVFASAHHLKNFPRLLHTMQERLSTHTLIGCTGGGVIGDRHEVENRPALALMAAHLPDVSVTSFHIEQPELEEEWPESYWQNRLGVTPEEEPIFVVLPIPL